MPTPGEENRELTKLARIIEMHESEGKSVDHAALGFVFTEPEIKTHLQARRRRRLTWRRPVACDSTRTPLSPNRHSVGFSLATSNWQLANCASAGCYNPQWPNLWTI